MANVFCGRFPISRRYDVKGATHGRAASRAERAKGARATCERARALALTRARRARG